MTLIESRENIFQNNSYRSLVIAKVNQVSSRQHEQLVSETMIKVSFPCSVIHSAFRKKTMFQ